MCGLAASHRCMLSCPPGARAGADGSGCPCLIAFDLDGSFGIGAAELDAIEAYLMPQILALLESSSLVPDSEGPHIPKTNKDGRVAKEKYRGVLVKNQT